MHSVSLTAPAARPYNRPMIRLLRQATLLLVLLSALTLCSCAERNLDLMSAREIYETGMQDFDKGRHSRALGAFQGLIELYPFSMYVTPAELRISDSYYHRRMYPESVEAYNDFITRHPTNKEVPHALYMLGLANYKQKFAIDRDQFYTHEALKYFQRVIKEYPDSENHADALDKAAECRHDLARREEYVGRFYYRNKEYFAALGRYREIIEQYKDTEFYAESLYMAGRCYLALDSPDAARLLLDTLIAEFPDDKYASRARSVLNDLN
ncbi:MAG: outer membrane protein assembly factor BamD [Candidatus Alcyoniella australis]|nr:outer membrane protein assembly factor BamD [Candidatus Alcyoniella australis]